MGIHKDLYDQINIQAFPNTENITDQLGKRSGKWIIWLNKDHMETTSHEFTRFYRVCNYDNGIIVDQVHDYYLSGELRAVGSVKDNCWDGDIKYYFPDGKIEQTERYKNCQLNGKRTVYFNDGSIKLSGYFVKDDREGDWYENFPNGATKYKGTYRLGKRIGLWKEYNEKGKLIEGEVYDEGEIVPAKDFVSRVISYTNDNRFQKAHDFINWIKDYYELHSMTNESRTAELDYYLSEVKFKKELYSEAMDLILKAVPKIKDKTLKRTALFTQLELAGILTNHIILERSISELSKLIDKKKQVNLYDKMKYLEALGYYGMGENIKAQKAIDNSSLDKWLQATYKGKSVFDDKLQKYSQTKGNTLSFKPGEIIVIDIYFTELLLLHTKLQIRSEFYQEAYANVSILERMAEIGTKLKEFLQLLDSNNNLAYIPMYEVRLTEYNIQKAFGQKQEAVKIIGEASDLVSAAEKDLESMHSVLSITEALVVEEQYSRAEALIETAIKFFEENDMKDSYSYGRTLVIFADILNAKKEIEQAEKLRSEGKEIIRKTTG